MNFRMQPYGFVGFSIIDISSMLSLSVLYTPSQPHNIDLLSSYHAYHE